MRRVDRGAVAHTATAATSPFDSERASHAARA